MVHGHLHCCLFACLGMNLLNLSEMHVHSPIYSMFMKKFFLNTYYGNCEIVE